MDLRRISKSFYKKDLRSGFQIFGKRIWGSDLQILFKGSVQPCFSDQPEAKYFLILKMYNLYLSFVTLASVSGVARYMATVRLRLMYVSDVACNMATVRLRPMSARGYSISVMLALNDY